MTRGIDPISMEQQWRKPPCSAIGISLPQGVAMAQPPLTLSPMAQRWRKSIAGDGRASSATPDGSLAGADHNLDVAETTDKSRWHNDNLPVGSGPKVDVRAKNRTPARAVARKKSHAAERNPTISVDDRYHTRRNGLQISIFARQMRHATPLSVASRYQMTRPHPLSAIARRLTPARENSHPAAPSPVSRSRLTTKSSGR